MIGVVLAVGLFMLWRIIQRTETRVAALADQLAMSHEALLSNMSKPAVQNGEGGGGGGSGGGGNDDGMEYTDEDEILIGPEQLVAEMKQLFGGNGFPSFPDAPSTVKITEMPQEDGDNVYDKVQDQEDSSSRSAPQQQQPAPDAHHDSESEASSKPLSKTKLMKMNLESLKEVLNSRGLSTDGSKKEMIARILGE
jgi:hypothetical protein